MKKKLSIPYLKSIQIPSVSKTALNLTVRDFLEITMVFPRSARMVFLSEFQHFLFWLWILEKKGRDIVKNLTQCLKSKKQQQKKLKTKNTYFFLFWCYK